MKNKTMAILFASNSGCQLNDLTIHRTAASLPFAGRYRLIDFILSNLVEAGVSNVGIVTRSNYNSLTNNCIPTYDCITNICTFFNYSTWHNN